jgi:hypothetical protein
MTDFPPQVPPPPLPPTAPATLPYADPGVYQRPRPRTPYIARVAIGCFGYLLLTGAWIALGAISPAFGKAAWSGWALMTVALLAFSLYLRHRFGFSGVGVGILISFGVGVAITALLVIGVVLLLVSLCGKNNKLTTPSATPSMIYPSTTDSQPATEPASQPTDSRQLLRRCHDARARFI